MQSCASCGSSVETTGLEPFGKVNCPSCGHQLRVERVFENYLVVEPLGKPCKLKAPFASLTATPRGQAPAGK